MVDTVTTSPDALYTVSYDVDGAGPIPPAEVVTTAPHPFYVTDYDRFVPAVELKPGDTFRLADGTSADVVSLTVERAAPGESFTTYNFEVTDFHTYFVNAEGVWVHNSGKDCEKLFSLYKRFRDRAPSTETPYETLVRIRERLESSVDGVPGNVWRLAAKDVSDDMFQKVAAGDLSLDKLPSYTEWKSRFSPGLGSSPAQADDIHIHHVVESWMQRRLGLTGDYNAVPGYLMPGADHTPSVGSLANRLANEIRNAGLTDPLAITTKMKEIYLSEGLSDLWNVAKKWLDVKGIPTP